MSQVKSLWAMVQGDPVFMRRVNGWLTIFWIADDPGFAGDALAGQRRLRFRAVVVGAGVRALVGVAGGPGRGRPAAPGSGAGPQDIAGEIVERVVADTDVQPALTARVGTGRGTEVEADS